MNAAAKAFAVALSLLLLVGSSSAQSVPRSSTHYFARGIELYRQGRYAEAVNEMDLASGLAPHDARIYFLRGLSKLRMGSQYDAEGDFQMGAAIEIDHGRRDVGMALQRVQGSERRLIERYRSEARKSAAWLAAERKAATQQQAADRTPAAETDEATPKATDETNGEESDIDPSLADEDSDLESEPEAVESPASTTSDARPAKKRPVSNFRLANLQPDETDPFATTSAGFLGRGELRDSGPVATGSDLVVEPQEAGDDLSADTSDEPVGSGVNSDENVDTDDSSLAGESPAMNSEDAAGGEKRSSALGAALRAMMRVLPTDSLTRQGQNLLPRGIPGMPPAGPPDEGGPLVPGTDATPDGAFEDADPFAEPTVDPPAENGDDSLEESADDEGAEEAEDPFADEPQ